MFSSKYNVTAILLVAGMLGACASSDEVASDAVEPQPSTVEMNSDAMDQAEGVGMVDGETLTDVDVNVDEVGSVETNLPESMTFEVPEGWVQNFDNPGTVQFTLPGFGDTNQAAMVTVVHDVENVDTPKQVVQSWRKQFSTSQEGVKSGARVGMAKRDGMTFYMADLAGTFMQETSEMPNQRMLGTIVESDSGRVFVTLVGDRGVVAGYAASYRRFVQSIQM